MTYEERIKQLEEKVAKLESIIIATKENDSNKVTSCSIGFTQDESILWHPKYFAGGGYYITLAENKSKFILKDLTISKHGTQWETENTAYRKTEQQAWEDREKYLQMQKELK